MINVSLFMEYVSKGMDTITQGTLSTFTLLRYGKFSQNMIQKSLKTYCKSPKTW
jgi:hypothetical protein